MSPPPPPREARRPYPGPRSAESLPVWWGMGSGFRGSARSIPGCGLCLRWSHCARAPGSWPFVPSRVASALASELAASCVVRLGGRAGGLALGHIAEGDTLSFGFGSGSGFPPDVANTCRPTDQHSAQKHWPRGMFPAQMGQGRAMQALTTRLRKACI